MIFRTTCQIGSAGGEKCRREARKDSSLKSAKEAMYSAIDNCFDGKIGNPFSVLRMTGGTLLANQKSN